MRYSAKQLEAARTAIDTVAKDVARHADTPMDQEPASAEETFRSCTEQGWDHAAWSTWFEWAKLVRNHDFFDTSVSRKSEHRVHYYGAHDDALSVEHPGEFSRDQALEILKEFGQEDILADFEQFWSTVHACLQFPQLTASALRMDSEVYGGTFGLAERHKEAKELLQRKGLV